jgi:putative endonuclease
MKTSVEGGWGESVAAEYLRKKGYEIIAANYHSRFGEIDLIAQKDDIIAFIEVKTRKNVSYARPMESVTPIKMKKIVSTAMLWLQSHKCENQPRFDVIEVYTGEDLTQKPKRIEHLENVYIGW